MENPSSFPLLPRLNFLFLKPNMKVWSLAKG